MKKYTQNDFIINTNYKKINYGLFAEQDEDTYTIINKWTGETINNNCKSIKEAQEIINTIINN